MKKKKAFTLIELLAVIVILAIISLIVGVTIGNIIDKSKKETYRNSIRNLIKSGENFVAQYVIDNNKDLTYPMIFTCDGNECSNGTSKLQVSGKVPRSGRIIVESQKNIRVEYLYNGSYCASGIKDSIQIAKTCTDIDITKPTITAAMSGKNVILTLTDNESGIGSYCVTSTNSFNNCEWINTTSTNVTHPLTVSGTYYAFARDKKLNISDSIMFDTGDIVDPSLTSTLDGKVISSTFSDNVAVTHFCLSEEENSENCEWETLEENQTTKDVTLASAGTYYVYVKDGVGNITRSNGIVAPSSAFCTLPLNSAYTFTYLTSYNGATVSGAIEEWIVPCDGTYKLEVWGAGGASGSEGNASKGGYSAGNIVLRNNQKIYIGVGSSAGYNGGGGAYGYGSGTGGGATHIALNNNRGVLEYYDSYREDIAIVAGGGGGGAGVSANSCCSNQKKTGGAGGGESGISANGAGGAQTTGNAFGKGGTGSGFRAGGGGGGWYGGRSCTSSSNTVCTGGGGSGYIGGVTDGTSIAGNASMPKHDGTTGTMTGNSGNGYARITLIAY